VKRAHTVKFNDPLGLARANERKAGSRTVFGRSPAERETHGGKESVHSVKYIHLQSYTYDICTYEETRLWVNVSTRKQSEREWPKLRAASTGRLRRSIAWVRSSLRRRQPVVGDGGFRRGCLLPVFSVVIITVVQSPRARMLSHRIRFSILRVRRRCCRQWLWL